MKKYLGLLALCLILFNGLALYAQTEPKLDIAVLKANARRGDTRAQFNLGLCYAQGKGVPVDKEESFKWLQKAAEQGHPIAQGAVASCYRNGAGVPKDAEESFKWLRKAAEQGNATAQHLLGLYYFKGIGVPKDDGEAVKWFRKAAEQGYKATLSFKAAQKELGLDSAEWEKIKAILKELEK